jgi:uncharacterized membrane protein YbhN (UPF0104 family)
LRLIALLARIGVAAGLTAYLLWRSQPREVLDALVNARWLPIGFAILLVLIDRVLMATRWVQLLCIVQPGARPRLPALLRIFFVSTFLGTFLPASVGGDAVRAYSLARLRVSGADAVASVVVDRMTGLASLLLMAIVGLMLARDLAGDAAVLTALALSAGLCALFAGLIASRRFAAGAGALLNVLPGGVQRLGHRLIGSLQRYDAFRWELVAVLASSIGVQVLRIAQAYLLGLGLGITASLDAYFAFVPLILIVMLLPITINGIGTSQAAFVWLFARVGVSEPLAFALSVLFVALGVVGNLPGALLYATGAVEPPPPATGAPSRAG